MKSTSIIIKEIEQYFLNLSKKGIMLSSKDYHLITEWIDKGYTREQILMGIRNCFEAKDIKRIRNISDCSEFVETKDLQKPREIKKTVITKSDNINYIVRILNNFENLLTKDTTLDLNSFINTFNVKLKELINSDKENMFANINRLEENFFKEFPDHLSTGDMKSYKTEINDFVNSGNDYINEKAKNKALNNFTKNFIIDNYLGFNPFEI